MTVGRARFTLHEAWMLLDNGEWHPANVVDVLWQAAVLSEADYNRTFGRRRDLPSMPLPMHAFSRDGWRSPLV